MRFKRSKRQTPKENYKILCIVLDRLQDSEMITPNEVEAFEDMMYDYWLSMDDEDRKEVVQSFVEEPLEE